MDVGPILPMTSGNQINDEELQKEIIKIRFESEFADKQRWPIFPKNVCYKQFPV